MIRRESIMGVDVALKRDTGAAQSIAEPTHFIAILPTARLPRRKCWWTHTDLPAEQAWALVIDGKPASRGAIDAALLPSPVPTEMTDLLDALNVEVSEPDVGELSVGLCDITHPRVSIQRSCSHSYRTYEEVVPPLGRGLYEPAIGLRSGEVPTRLGAFAASVLAPKLAAFLARWYPDAAPPERLFTRAEHRERLARKESEAAAAAYKAGVDQAAGALAQLLWGKRDAQARADAIQVAAAIDSLKRAQAAR